MKMDRASKGLLHSVRDAIALSVCALALSWSAHATPAPRPIMTSEGPVSGVQSHDVMQFLGIPYAEAPVGDLRWMPPVVPTQRHELLQADHYRDACPQVSRYNLTEASDEEDCLYLNIAVPAAPSRDGRPRPVIFWIHGGAYVGGGANLYRLDHWAKRGDVVIVSINYRLGALGFLSHRALDGTSTGAFGLADQQAALRWVHHNIAAFGGDPSRVTIAGESAGAASVCALLAAPEQIGGLVARAIIQSAACDNPLRSTAAAEATGDQFAAAVGCDGADVLACLRRVPLAKILAAQTQMAATALLTWAPSVGSKVLPRQPTEAVAQGLVHVPVMNGGTRDEMRLYIGYEVVAGHPYTLEDYRRGLAAYYGDFAAEVEAHYPPAQYSSPSTALGTALSDYGPGIPLANCTYLRFGRALSQHTTVYEYEFADRGAPPVMEDPGVELGAVHSAELPYFFPGFSNRSVWDGPPLGRQHDRLSDEMIDFWASFARAGVPHVHGEPVWPRFKGADSVYRFDAGPLRRFDADAAHQCGFWRALYPHNL